MPFICITNVLMKLNVRVMVSKILSFTEITFNIIQSKVNFFEMKYDSTMSSSITDELIQNFALQTTL